MRNATQKGFTLVEMLVVTPIVILAIGAFLTVIISITGEVIATRAANTLTFNMQDTLNRIEQDVKISNSFLATNSVSLVAGNAQGYNDDATAFTNVGGVSGTVLVLEMTATTGDPLSGDASFVYLANSPNGCASADVFDNTPMSYNVVYFIKDDTLWRRTIMPNDYALGTYSCATAWQRPSCSPGYTAAFCVTEDAKLIEGVSQSGFSIEYLASSSETVPLEDASNASLGDLVRQDSLFAAKSVQITIQGEQIAAGRTVQESASRTSTRVAVTSSNPINVAGRVPAIPQNFTASLSTPGVFNTSWGAADRAQTYTIQYATNSSFTGATSVTGVTATSRQFTGLNVGEAYYFRVAAVNAVGQSGWSDPQNDNSTYVNNLIGWWRFNGNASDSSGNGVNGTLYGNPTGATSESGLADGAYQLDGSGDYIFYGEQYNSVGLPVTFSGWVYHSSSSGLSSLVMTDGSSAGYLGWRIQINTNNTVEASYGTGNATGVANRRSFITTGTIPTNSWRNITAVISNYNTIRVYFNGVQQSGAYSGSANSMTTSTSSSPMRFGRYSVGGNIDSADRFDDFRVYDRVLTNTEITDLYNAGAW